jgi:hypothetical protein
MHGHCPARQAPDVVHDLTRLLNLCVKMSIMPTDLQRRGHPSVIGPPDPIAGTFSSRSGSVIFNDADPFQPSNWSAGPLKPVITRNWDRLLEDAVSRRDAATRLAFNFNIPDSYPTLPPALDSNALPLSAPQARRLHGVTRNATSLERNSVHTQIYMDASAFSSAAISDLLKVLSGRKPRARSDQARRDRTRLRSLWQEVAALLDRMQHLAPPSLIARDGKRLLIRALKSARARLAARVKIRGNPAALASCAAANSPLANDIMRHGPPLAACLYRHPSGSEPRQYL